MSTLYVLSTPIGNLYDLSSRAKDILDNIEFVIAEDTRVSKKLFSNNQKKIKMVSVHDHSSLSKINQAIKLLNLGDTVLVSDAGTPGVSDPGAKVVKIAMEKGHIIVPIPGASAITTALSICPWPTNKFTFLGFLPRKEREKIINLEEIVNISGLIVFFESPHRIINTLQSIKTVMNDREVFICRELTKIHEETFTGKPSDAIKYFSNPKGEFTIIIKGNSSQKSRISDETILKEISIARNKELIGRKIVDYVINNFSVSRSRVYRLEIQSRKQIT